MTCLTLPDVTLCAATSVNVDATVRALLSCTLQVRFADVVLFSDSVPAIAAPEIRIVPISPLQSGADYSNFILAELADHVRTSHCLIVQWDGFVLDARQWDPTFLEYDYVGAPWPQFGDGYDVGNGGFSLRSRRLLEACREPDFSPSHPEDLAIGRHNRALLERNHSIRFAPRSCAQHFSFERGVPSGPTFGFHGVFNMIPAIGRERFWAIYDTLDHRKSAFVDYRQLLSQAGFSPQGLLRVTRLTADWIGNAIGRKSA